MVPTSGQQGDVGTHGSPPHTTIYQNYTKLQNNHHSKLSRIELNGRPTTMELKKLHPSRLLGDMETWNGVIPNLHVVDKNLGGEVPAPQQAPQPRVPVQGR